MLIIVMVILVELAYTRQKIMLLRLRHLICTFTAGLLLTLGLIGGQTARAADLIPVETVGKPNLLRYWGGLTMGAHKVHLLWWAGGRSWPAGYKEHVIQYFQDVAAASGSKANVYAVIQEYEGDDGKPIPYQVEYGGSYTIPSPYPSRRQCTVTQIKPCLGQGQMELVMREAMRVNNWQAGMEDAYLLFTPPGVGMCTYSMGCSSSDSKGGFSADHEATADATPIVWAMMPYPYHQWEENSIDPKTDITRSLSHEHIEMITDPIATPMTIQAGDSTGWMTARPDQEEISDICNGYSINGDDWATQSINGHIYSLAKQWSNRRGVCSGSSTLAYPRVHLIYPRSAKAGQWVTIDAGGSQNPDLSTPLRFEWRSGGYSADWWRVGKHVLGHSKTIQIQMPRRGRILLDLRVIGTNQRTSYRTIRIPVSG